MNRLALFANTVTRRLDQMFPGFFTGAKHNVYRDFGFPDQVDFALTFAAYTRNGIARAAVDKTVGKTWETVPFLLEKERDGSTGGDQDETKAEKDIRERFTDLRLWQHLAEADRRSLVGCYAGVILRFADGKKFDEPVERVGGGLEGLVEVIPAWEGQLTVSDWDTEETSPTFGQPKMFGFNEAAVGERKQGRTMTIHPDRVILWSRDGTVHGRSFLEPGYNDLMTMEKVVGGGGEGFWKNAKSAPVLEMPADAKASDMAKAMGVPLDEVADKMNENVEAYQKGFDQLLMLQGMTAKTLGVTLPSPEHFFGTALQCFAASIQMPLKILVGSQTGERASTEDAAEWAKVVMSRREGQTVPNIRLLVARLEQVGILPERDWHIDWTDLTESSMEAKIERAAKMADVNKKMEASGEWVFTPEEIRGAVDYEPLADADKYREHDHTEEETPDEIDETEPEAAAA